MSRTPNVQCSGGGQVCVCVCDPGGGGGERPEGGTEGRQGTLGTVEWARGGLGFGLVPLVGGGWYHWWPRHAKSRNVVPMYRLQCDDL